MAAVEAKVEVEGAKAEPAEAVVGPRATYNSGSFLEWGRDRQEAKHTFPAYLLLRFPCL